MSVADNKALLAAGAAAAAVVAVGGAVAGVVALTRKSTAQAQKELIDKYGHDGRVHLFGYPRCVLTPCFSFYVLRLEAFLRLAGIPYEYHPTMNFTPSPSGTVPYIVYGNRVLSESKSIMEWLTVEFNVEVDNALSKEQRAESHALVSMIDYSYFPNFARTIFTTAGGHREFLPHIMKGFGLGAVARVIFPPVLKMAYTKRMQLNGAAKLTTAQYEEQMLRDLEALEGIIGDKPFVHGDAITTADLSVYGVLLATVRLHQRKEAEAEAAEAEAEEKAAAAAAKAEAEEKKAAAAAEDAADAAADAAAEVDPEAAQEAAGEAADAAEQAQEAAEAAEEAQAEAQAEKAAAVLVSEPIQYVGGSAVLREYVDRISAALFPDMEELLCTVAVAEEHVTPEEAAAEAQAEAEAEAEPEEPRTDIFDEVPVEEQDAQAQAEAAQRAPEPEAEAPAAAAPEASAPEPEGEVPVEEMPTVDAPEAEAEVPVEEMPTVDAPEAEAAAPEPAAAQEEEKKKEHSEEEL